MSEAPNIVDYVVYNNRMVSSILDKLFFLDKIFDSNLIVDFGCSDGVLLNECKRFRPELRLIGYDNDPSMLRIGNSNEGKFPITDNWEHVLSEVKKSVNATIVLSSVLHEVFHYGSRLDIDVFWKNVFESGFEYIVIRDMIPGKHIDRPAHINDVKKVYTKFFDRKELVDFETFWGNIETNKQLIHFLLKYKYATPNWEREVRENYMPLYRESLLAKIPVGYDIIYHEHYVLPYLFHSVKTDFGIEIKDATHLKLILKRV